MNPRRTPSSRLLAPRLVVVGHDPRTRRSASVRAQPSDWRNVVATQAYDGTRSSSRSPRRSAAAPSAVRPRRSSSTTVVGRSCSTPVTSSPPRSGPNAGPTSPAGTPPFLSGRTRHAQGRIRERRARRRRQASRPIAFCISSTGTGARPCGFPRKATGVVHPLSRPGWVTRRKVPLEISVARLAATR